MARGAPKAFFVAVLLLVRLRRRDIPPKKVGKIPNFFRGGGISRRMIKSGFSRLFFLSRLSGHSLVKIYLISFSPERPRLLYAVIIEGVFLLDSL